MSRSEKTTFKPTIWSSIFGPHKWTDFFNFVKENEIHTIKIDKKQRQTGECTNKIDKNLHRNYENNLKEFNDKLLSNKNKFYNERNKCHQPKLKINLNYNQINNKEAENKTNDLNINDNNIYKKSKTSDKEIKTVIESNFNYYCCIDEGGLFKKIFRSDCTKRDRDVETEFTKNKNVDNRAKRKCYCSSKKNRNREIGVKFELLWAGKCLECNRKHSCRCIELTPSDSLISIPEEPKVDRKKIVNNKDILDDDDIKKSDYKKEIPVENQKPKTEPEITEQTKFLPCPCKSAGDPRMVVHIQKAIDEMGERIKNIETMVNCFDTALQKCEDEANKPKTPPSTIIYEPKVPQTSDDRYVITRSPSDPCTICIRPPKNKQFITCDNDKKHRDCVRIRPNEDTFYVHGSPLTNEDEMVDVIGNICDNIGNIFCCNLLDSGSDDSNSEESCGCYNLKEDKDEDKNEVEEEDNEVEEEDNEVEEEDNDVESII